MKIGLLESNSYPVPTPKDVISAPLELVRNLANNLPKLGVDVTLFASSDSIVESKLFSADLPSLYKTNKDKGGFHLNTVEDVQIAAAFESILIAKSYQHAEQNGFDLIHSHPLGRTLPFSTMAHIPTVYTLHIPLKSPSFRGKEVPTYLDQLFTLQKLAHEKNNYFVSISDAQRRAAPKLNYIKTVYNGVDVSDIPFSPEPGSYLVVLGRIVEEKGCEYSIEIAKKSDTTLKIAGLPSTTNPDYWDKKIHPSIDEKTIIYEGIVKGKEKNNLLKNALALVFPIQWEEPFGMVMTEAMAAGTPVIAYDRGSVREVVKDGETGFICSTNDVDAMVGAVKKLKNMSEDQHRKMREECRKHVADNFSTEKMVSGYRDVYRQVIDQSKKQAKQPDSGQ